MRVLEAVGLSTHKLAHAGITQPRREAEEILASLLGIRWAALYLKTEYILSASEQEQMHQAVERRAQREPLAYIQGRLNFFDTELELNSAGLIPRPETEILVEKIAASLASLPLLGKVLWDVCTGSGCIGLSLKNRFPHLAVVLSDISVEAIKLAEKNAARCPQTSRAGLHIRHGDLFAPFAQEKCHFFVCNPPYLSEEEYAAVAPELHWEPRTALVAGKTGLEFYQRIADQLVDYVYPEAKGWLEIGAGQGEHVVQMFQEKGWDCHYEKDWAGLDRFVFLTIRTV